MGRPVYLVHDPDWRCQHGVYAREHCRDCAMKVDILAVTAVKRLLRADEVENLNDKQRRTLEIIAAAAAILRR